MKNYGVRGADVHKWIDEFSRFVGKPHRKYRHDPHKLLTDPNYLPMKFKDKYGSDLAINIAWDHYVADGLVENIDPSPLPPPDKDLKEKVFSPLDDFMKKNLIKTEGTNTLVHDAYVAYYEYCKQKNIVRCSRPRFIRILRKDLPTKVEFKQLYFINIQLIRDIS